MGKQIKKYEPELCSELDCTGCHACYNVCPNNSIEMTGNENNFLYPKINLNTCIRCGKCEESCPIITPPTSNNLTKPIVYAGFHKNINIRKNSTSGGAFTAISQFIFENDGKVFGAGFTKNKKVAHYDVESCTQLIKLQKSKYVQSSIGNSYQEAKSLLEKNRYVLFTGVPCQIAGLYSYLGKNYEKLFTAEIICHGTPSPLLLEKFISFVEWKKNKKFRS